MAPSLKKLLGWRIHKQQAERFVHKVKDPQTNKMNYQSEDIEKAFQKYYTNLYSTQVITGKEI